MTLATTLPKASYTLTALLAFCLCVCWLFGVDVDGVYGAGTVTALPFCVIFALGTLGTGWFAKTKCLLPLLTIVVIVFLSTTGIAKSFPSYTTQEPFSIAWLLPVFACVVGMLVGALIIMLLRGSLLGIRKLSRSSKSSA